AMIESAADFIAMMGWQKNENEKQLVKQRELFPDLEPNEKTVVELLQQKESTHIDELMLTLTLSSSQLASALLTLELNGVVKGMPGKMYKLN
ncbi:MAG: DNA-protecting protein DprA, partial [Bacteroidota bacterium]